MLGEISYFCDMKFKVIILTYKKVSVPLTKANAKVYKLKLKLFDFSPIYQSTRVEKCFIGIMI